MWNDGVVTLKNFYGMLPPDAKVLKDRAKKVAKIIKDMGDKYCLAKPVEKKNADPKAV